MRATVLFVDDDELIIEGLKRSLHGIDYQVTTAVGAWAGVEALRSAGPDIVVADQYMPGMTGLDFLAVVREQRPEAIRILLSGRADLEIALRALNEGEVFRFLTKPVERAELLVTLGLAYSKYLAEQESRRMRDHAQ
jgi:YesN/AraC family two-component response regulator